MAFADDYDFAKAWHKSFLDLLASASRDIFYNLHLKRPVEDASAITEVVEERSVNPEPNDQQNRCDIVFASVAHTKNRWGAGVHREN